MREGLQDFKEVWCVDYEYQAPQGEPVVPICMVGREYHSGKQLEIWQDELLALKEPPYNIGEDSLFVAYYVPAEMSCHLALGWDLPVNLLDLFVEFKNETNGLRGAFAPKGKSLLDALAWHDLPFIDAADKKAMRDLAMRGGPWTDQEREDLLAYCDTDVVALPRLLDKMLAYIDMPRALLRGRYMKVMSRMEYAGVPLDQQSLELLKKHWVSVQEHLIQKVDQDYGVYEGPHFKFNLFNDYLVRNNIGPWPRTPSGILKSDDETFRDMAKIFPQLYPLKELRYMLSQMKLSALPVGADGRNRFAPRPFASVTGRNQPSTSENIFGPSTWVRSLIKPRPGYGLAYLDWSQQEFGIAAALSGDVKMMEAYHSKEGDPYITVAIQAGAVPEGASKFGYEAIREQYKQCCLGMNYGMGERLLAHNIQMPLPYARALIADHKAAFKSFWKWIGGVLDYATLYARLWTTFGWTLRVGPDARIPALQNFLMQANAAEMLRLAAIMVSEAGIKVVATVHDALLIEAPLEALEKDVETAQELMEEASAVVLKGFRERTDATIVRYPDRYSDGRGEKLWREIMKLVKKRESVSSQQHIESVEPVSPVQQMPIPVSCEQQPVSYQQQSVVPVSIRLVYSGIYSGVSSYKTLRAKPLPVLIPDWTSTINLEGYIS